MLNYRLTIAVSYTHLNTRSTIVSKGISAGHSENSYRGLVRVAEKADNARNYSQCDSLLLGDKCGAHTFPYMDTVSYTHLDVYKRQMQKCIRSGRKKCCS